MDAPFLAISDDHLRPRPCAGTESHDRFRNRLENRLDPRHARVRRAGTRNGSRFDETFGVRYGPDRGSPGQPMRWMVERESLQPVPPPSDEAGEPGCPCPATAPDEPSGQASSGAGVCGRTGDGPAVTGAGAEGPEPAVPPAGPGPSAPEPLPPGRDGAGEATVSRSGQRRGLVSRRRKQCRRRRQAMEPVIGHRQSADHPGRNWLRGMAGDLLRAPSFLQPFFRDRPALGRPLPGHRRRFLTPGRGLEVGLRVTVASLTTVARGLPRDPVPDRGPSPVSTTPDATGRESGIVRQGSGGGSLRA